MARWLVRDLEATQAHWIVGFWHHPPYSKGSHDCDRDIEMVEMREWIMPILENGGVDLVLSGHSHLYERSMRRAGRLAVLGGQNRSSWAERRVSSARNPSSGGRSAARAAASASESQRSFST